MRQKKFRLPHLSRRARLARNLFLALFLVTASWVLAGCPAWTEAGALRQLERTLLLEPGTARYREAGERGWDAPTVLVTGENYAYTATIYQDTLFWHEADYPSAYASLDEGAVLFPWAEPDTSGSMEQGTWLCPNPPEGAERAELILSLEYELDSGLVRDYETGTAELRAQGTLEDSGFMRLEIQAETPREAVLLRELFTGVGYELAEDGTPWRDCTITQTSYQLEFFDGEGVSMGFSPVVIPMEM